MIQIFICATFFQTQNVDVGCDGKGFVTVTGCDILSVTLRDTCHESLETDNRSQDMRPVTLSSRLNQTQLADFAHHREVRTYWMMVITDHLCAESSAAGRLNTAAMHQALQFLIASLSLLNIITSSFSLLQTCRLHACAHSNSGGAIEPYHHKSVLIVSKPWGSRLKTSFLSCDLINFPVLLSPTLSSAIRESLPGQWEP